MQKDLGTAGAPGARRRSLQHLATRVALALGTLVAVGCARGPDVDGGGLGIKRAIIYRNGVGYFERQGHVESDEVTFRVRGEKVGDFLATLAVIEKGGSSVRSASFPVDVKKEREAQEAADDGDEDVDEKGPCRKKCKKDREKKDELEKVTLSLDGKGHDLIIGYVAETPVWRPSYRLVISHGPDGKADAAKPATTADLQAWGIVQNLSGEDWKGVKLSLVAGAPLAFQATLEKAVIPQRPVVADGGEVIASVPVGETSLAEGAPPPPPPAAAVPAAEPSGGGHLKDSLAGLLSEDVAARAEQRRADADEKNDLARSRKKGAAGKVVSRASSHGMRAPAPSARPMGMAAPAEMAPPPPPPAPAPQNPSPPRNLRSLAAVAMQGGTTHYDLPFPVDVPNKSATMVLLLSRPVPGESIFLFAPDGGVPQSGAHPFRVVRFTNDTAGLLERGPIAVFENGAFLGQGMVDPLPPSATATVPFALERSIAVESFRKDNEEGARVAQIEAGRIQVERDHVTHTLYTLKNGGDTDGRTLVKHARLYDTRLNNPPKGTEDNTGTGSALVPINVPKHGTATLDVDERRVVRRDVDWLDPLAAAAVQAYVSDARADQGVAAALRQAWDAREKLRAALDERNKLRAEKAQLDAQIDQLGSSLKAIEKNNLAEKLRKDLTERLARASARTDEITKRTIVLDMQLSEQSIRFRDLVAPIKMLKPLFPS